MAGPVPHDMTGPRALLLILLILQAAVSVTLGLLFVRLWRSFRRQLAFSWAMAWLVFGGGLLFSMAIGFGFGAGAPMFVQVLLRAALPTSALLFHAGTSSIVDPAHRYWRWFAASSAGVIAATVLVFAIWKSSGSSDGSLLLFVAPRVFLGAVLAWAVWPLRRVPLVQRPDGFGLLAWSLAAVSLRTLAAAAYEVWQMVNGVADRPESLVLTIVQICLLITLGVATAVVLIGIERQEAVRAAASLRQTADALFESEEKFRFVVEQSSDVAILIGPDRLVRYIAPSCERLVGFPPERFEGCDVIEFVHPDDRTVAANAFVRLTRDDPASPPPAATIVRIQHQDGRWLESEVRGRVVRGGNRAGAFVLSARDVTAQRTLEAALRHRQRIESLGHMASSVAHDFNNTLSAISGAVELAAEHVAPDHPASPFLQHASDGVEHGTALTRQLLMFSRRQESAPGLFEVRERVNALVPILRHTVGLGVAVDVLSPEEPMSVRADPMQFDQVLVNLCANARDAMPDGGRVTVRLERVATDSRDAFVRIGVEDTGKGIAHDVLPRIFEPFFTTKDVGKGTGLGLASAQGFAQQAGGSLSVDTTGASGTCFALRLPLASRPGRGPSWQQR
jgi:PAS domain S-box-containing protein